MKSKKKDISNAELKEENEKLQSDLDGFKRLMILLIILVVISVISQILYFYAHEWQEDRERIENSKIIDESIDEEDTTISKDSKEVKELLAKYNVFNNQLESANYFGYLYKNDKTEVSSISDKAKIYMALSNISFVDNKDLIDEDDNVTIPKEMVNNKIKELFGSDITYQDQSLVDEGNECHIAYFSYDSTKEEYLLKSYGHNQAAYYNTIETKITDASLNDDIMMIDVQIYKKVPNSNGYLIYKDMNSSEELATIDLDDDTDIFATYKDELAKYRYTFTKEDNNYILSKIEKIKEDA